MVVIETIQLLEYTLTKDILEKINKENEAKRKDEELKGKMKVVRK